MVQEGENTEVAGVRSDEDVTSGADLKPDLRDSWS